MRIVYNIIFTQPIYFTTPRFSEVNGGNLTNGIGAEKTAEAMQLAFQQAGLYAVAKGGTEAEIRIKMMEYLDEQMKNGIIKGGSASFYPPYGFDLESPPTQYQSYTIWSDSCN